MHKSNNLYSIFWVRQKIQHEEFQSHPSKIRLEVVKLERGDRAVYLHFSLGMWVTWEVGDLGQGSSVQPRQFPENSGWRWLSLGSTSSSCRSKYLLYKTGSERLSKRLHMNPKNSSEQSWLIQKVSPLGYCWPPNPSKTVPNWISSEGPFRTVQNIQGFLKPAVPPKVPPTPKVRYLKMTLKVGMSPYMPM